MENEYETYLEFLGIAFVSFNTIEETNEILCI